MPDNPEAMFEPRPTPPMQSFANVFLAHPGLFGKPRAPVEAHLTQAVPPNVQMSSSVNKQSEKISAANSLYISDEPSDTEVGSVSATSDLGSNNTNDSDKASYTKADSVCATYDSVNNMNIFDEALDTEVVSVSATFDSSKNSSNIFDEPSDTEAGSVSATSGSVSRVSSAAFISTAVIASASDNTIKANEANRGERIAKAQKWRSTIMFPLESATPAVVSNVLATPAIVQAKFSLMQTQQIIDRN
ncbi:hypothetical protein H4S00_001111 [Coemansia sp. D1744]|nr:hypothetical protein H4S00_001111 [Coemansia sp. D1744]